MSRMVRKQIVMEPEQEHEIAVHAASLGISQSELVRQAIDMWLDGQASEDRRKKAWEGTLAAIKAANRAGVGSRGQKWTREELHER
jgi:Arc/MetJ-type ribon-helix-helix transcriptional regulator